jgi:hypothetical protein
LLAEQERVDVSPVAVGVELISATPHSIPPAERKLKPFRQIVPVEPLIGRHGSRFCVREASMPPIWSGSCRERIGREVLPRDAEHVEFLVVDAPSGLHEVVAEVGVFDTKASRSS